MYSLGCLAVVVCTSTERLLRVMCDNNVGDRCLRVCSKTLEHWQGYVAVRVCKTCSYLFHKGLKEKWDVMGGEGEEQEEYSYSSNERDWNG